MTTRRNTIVLALGRKGSGKSVYLRDYWTETAPRLVTIDRTGEATEGEYDALVYDFASALDVFTSLLKEQVERWHVVAQLPEDDVYRLYWLLVPPDPRQHGISRAFGGVAVACDEVDVIAPNAGMHDSVKNALMRGRHYQLSQFYATQRPANCSRAVSSQADYVTSFRMHEPRDLKFLTDAVGVAFAELVSDLPKYAHAEYDANSGSVTVRDGNGKCLTEIDIGELTRRRSRSPERWQVELFGST